MRGGGGVGGEVFRAGPSPSGRANKATAHQLARLVYAMLTRGEEYVAREVADFEAERRDRQIRHLQRQAQRYNLALVDADAA